MMSLVKVSYLSFCSVTLVTQSRCVTLCLIKPSMIRSVFRTRILQGQGIMCKANANPGTCHKLTTNIQRVFPPDVNWRIQHNSTCRRSWRLTSKKPLFLKRWMEMRKKDPFFVKNAPLLELWLSHPNVMKRYVCMWMTKIMMAPSLTHQTLEMDSLIWWFAHHVVTCKGSGRYRQISLTQ